MTTLQSLTAARDNFAAAIADASVNPKLDYSLDGQSVSWTEYINALTQRINDLNKLINQVNPWQIVSKVM